MRRYRMGRLLLACLLLSSAASRAEQTEYRSDPSGKAVLVIHKDGAVETATFRPDGQQQRSQRDATHQRDIAPSGAQSR